MSPSESPSPVGPTALIALREARHFALLLGGATPSWAAPTFCVIVLERLAG